jgi:DnaJ-class molecular chaperone
MPRLRADKDYYRILNVAPGATEDEIRRAYRRLALEWHPDRNPGRPDAGERFKEISEAYAVLIDPAKRRDYDGARRRGSAHEFRRSREEVFRDLFSDPRASAVFDEIAQEFERMGVHVHARQFQEVLFGGRTVVRGGVMIVGPVTPWVLLGRLARVVLRGPAARPGPAVAPARPRGLQAGLARLGRWLLGSGAEVVVGGDHTAVLKLSRAEARRGVKKRVALEVDGRGEAVLVTVPAGVKAGTRLRLRGRGRTTRGGARGDLYLAVEITD